MTKRRGPADRKKSPQLLFELYELYLLRLNQTQCVPQAAAAPSQRLRSRPAAPEGRGQSEPRAGRWAAAGEQLQPPQRLPEAPEPKVTPQAAAKPFQRGARTSPVPPGAPSAAPGPGPGPPGSAYSCPGSSSASAGTCCGT